MAQLPAKLFVIYFMILSLKKVKRLSKNLDWLALHLKFGSVYFQQFGGISRPPCRPIANLRAWAYRLKRSAMIRIKIFLEKFHLHCQK